MADRLAKQRTALPQPKQPGTLPSAKFQIKSAVEIWNCQLLQRLSLGKNWESLVSRGSLDHNLPLAVSIAAFRMTGHDYLIAHTFTASISYHHQSASFAATVL
ncbi:hypothetical protein TNCT_307221 [Trichonephila clavata]|uniref:Uncharacterized protein n=1 Tax=Trichonephila clavata TaxID=2740835 RepID=A0A8X6H8E3_TRICU|nr:hypothetical protein TNCT_307221 [Trichonephila clavata]